MYCEIAAIDPTYTAETCAPMSMRELRDLLVRNGGDTSEGEGEHPGMGNGQGAGAHNDGAKGHGHGNENGNGKHTQE